MTILSRRKLIKMSVAGGLIALSGCSTPAESPTYQLTKWSNPNASIEVGISSELDVEYTQSKAIFTVTLSAVQFADCVWATVEFPTYDEKVDIEERLSSQTLNQDSPIKVSPLGDYGAVEDSVLLNESSEGKEGGAGTELTVDFYPRDEVIVTVYGGLLDGDSVVITDVIMQYYIRESK